jgi:hypothetical protein
MRDAPADGDVDLDSIVRGKGSMDCKRGRGFWGVE